MATKPFIKLLGTLLPTRGKGIAYNNATDPDAVNPDPLATNKFWSVQLQSPDKNAQNVSVFTNLADSITTTLDDDVIAPNPYNTQTDFYKIGLNILDGDTVNTLAGHDVFNITQTLSGANLQATGIKIGAGSSLATGAGNEKFIITLVDPGSVGIDIGNNGILDLGGDVNNLRIDVGTNGIVNRGSIKGGANTDRLDASTSHGHAIDNSGIITLCNGVDNFGNVDPTKGLLDSGKDVLTGNSVGHFALDPTYTPGQFGINNTGTINMGGGKDVLDALVGGFGGGGTYNLGWTKTVNGVTTQDTDADAVLGFGSGTFNGGGGRNSITLPAGTYQISYATADNANAHTPASLTELGSGAITRNGDTLTKMVFNQFDSIGGNGLAGALHLGELSAADALFHPYTKIEVLANGNAIGSFA